MKTLQLQKAEQICREYAEALVAAQKTYTLALPEKLLPHSQLVIKNAIKKRLETLGVEKRITDDNLLELRTAYVSLGQFVSQDDADLVKDYRASAANEVSAGRAVNRQRFQFVTNKVRIQEEDYLQEFKVFYSRMVKGKDTEGPD